MINHNKIRLGKYYDDNECIWCSQVLKARMGDSLVAQMIKHLPAMQETQVQSLGHKDPLEKEMVTHSSTLTWKIPWTEEPGRVQSMGSQRVGHCWAFSLTMLIGDPEHPWEHPCVVSVYNSDISAGQKELMSSHWSFSYFTSSYRFSFNDNWWFKDHLLNWTINHGSNVVLLS